MTQHTQPADEQAAAEALALLRKHALPDEHGYVTLNAVPYRAHHLLLTEALRLTAEGSTVFEGGVSSGYFARTMVEAGRTVDGHELDPAAAADARSVCRNVIEGDLQAFDPASELPGNTYDLVIFGDTLEHIPDPAAVLRRFIPAMNPGAHLVISVPNVANWSIRAQLAAGRFNYVDRGILDRTHLRLFTVRTATEMIESAGFRVVRTQAAVPVPGVTSERAARITHRIGNLRPNLFAYNIVLTAEAPS